MAKERFWSETHTACPRPVFILATYNEDGTANAMKRAWGGIVKETSLTLRT